MSQLTFDGSIEPQKDTPAKKDSWYKGRTLSYSSINLYQTCPQKWKFKYVDKIPEKPKSFFSFGKSVHSALEYLFSKFPDDVVSLDELLSHYKENWIQEGYESPSQAKWFFQEGERILKGFYAKHSDDFKKVFKIEYKFTFDIDGVPMTGFIDRIDELPSGNLSILDYKTGRAFDKSRVRNEAQLTLYQMATKELLGKDVESVGLYHLNSLTSLVVPAHSTGMENKMRQTVVSSAKGINESIFDPKPDATGHCKWCDYVQICPAFSGKKAPLSIEGITKVSVKEDIDRLGELEEKIQDINEEKLAIKKSLGIYFKNTGKSEATGNKYKATRTDDDYIEVSPK